MYSNSHNLRNNDWVELILVLNTKEFPVAFKNSLKLYWLRRSIHLKRALTAKYRCVNKLLLFGGKKCPVYRVQSFIKRYKSTFKRGTGMSSALSLIYPTSSKI